MAKKTQKKKKDLELLKKACPAVFGRNSLFPLTEAKQRYVSFTVTPEIFHFVRKWLDNKLEIEIFTGCHPEDCQIYLVNKSCLADSKGRFSIL